MLYAAGILIVVILLVRYYNIKVRKRANQLLAYAQERDIRFHEKMHKLFYVSLNTSSFPLTDITEERIDFMHKHLRALAALNLHPEGKTVEGVDASRRLIKADNEERKSQWRMYRSFVSKGREV